MPKRTNVHRYLLFAGDKNSRPGWSTFVTASNYLSGLQLQSPEWSTWYQIVDLKTGEVVAERYYEE